MLQAAASGRGGRREISQVPAQINGKIRYGMPAEDQASTETPFQRYVKILEPMFGPSQDNNVDIDTLFRHVCCLVREGGIEAPDTLNSPLFGQATSVNPMRRVDIGFNLNF
jgi:hypothetical protein